MTFKFPSLTKHRHLNQRYFAIHASMAFALAIVAAGLSIWGIRSIQPNMEDVLQWLPDRAAERVTYERFLDRFGTDDFFVVRWEGCTIQDERCDRFVDSVLQLDHESLVDSARSGRDIIRQRPAPRIQSPSQIVEQFHGIFFGPNQGDTCVVIELTRRGMANRGDAIELVDRAADTVPGLDSDSLWTAGYPAIANAADQLIKYSLLYSFVPCCLLSVLAASVFVRDVKLVGSILIVAALAAGLCIASITLTGSKWGAMSTVIPALTYVLTISGTLHLVNYAVRDIDSDSNDSGDIEHGRYRRALSRGWKPCVISSLTTGVGVLALTQSDFPAIRQFGVYCAVGTVISLACQLLLAPVLLQIFGGQQQAIKKGDRFFDAHYRFIVKFNRPLIVGFVVAAGCLLAGIPSLRSNLEVERFFTSDSGVLDAVERIESTIGPVEQTELIVEFPSANAGSLEHRIAFIRALQIRLESKASISDTISAATWVPPTPARRGIGGVAERVAYRKRIARLKPDLQETQYFISEREREWWRISIRFPFLASTDFVQLDRDVTAAFSNQLANHRTETEIPLMTHTGVSMLYHLGQGRLLSDLLFNFGTAFAIICVILFVVLRSWSLGLIAILPNAIPALVLFGALGWIGYSIDLSIAIMACVALGIAVDDTTHFIIMHDDLMHHKATSSSNLDPLQQTIGQCGPAMIATTAIITAGFTAFLFGEIAIMIRFALSMIATLFFAMLCDLLLLPSMLYRFDRPQDAATKSDPNDLP